MTGTIHTMNKHKLLKIFFFIITGLTLFFALAFGISVGAAIAEVKNTIAVENF